ncbi:MAG: hypothetical protein IJ228_10615 [Succinivibrio sp.]|nr:hypothetical protein [Succinivibrio sp.]
MPGTVPDRPRFLGVGGPLGALFTALTTLPYGAAPLKLTLPLLSPVSAAVILAMPPLYALYASRVLGIAAARTPWLGLMVLQLLWLAGWYGCFVLGVDLYDGYYADLVAAGSADPDQLVPPQAQSLYVKRMWSLFAGIAAVQLVHLILQLHLAMSLLGTAHHPVKAAALAVAYNLPGLMLLTLVILLCGAALEREFAFYKMRYLEMVLRGRSTFDPHLLFMILRCWLLHALGGALVLNAAQSLRLTALSTPLQPRSDEEKS